MHGSYQGLSTNASGRSTRQKDPTRLPKNHKQNGQARKRSLDGVMEVSPI